MMFLMRLFFWKQYNEKTRMTKTCTLHVHSRFFYFVKFLNLPALVEHLNTSHTYLPMFDPVLLH